MPRAVKQFTRLAGLRWASRTGLTRNHSLKRFSSEARTLQWIDRWFGVPLCFLLTTVRRIGGLLGDGAPKPVGSILFLKLAEQGSTVLAHEAVRRAVERVGRENVHFLVFEENRFIVDVIGLVPPGNVFTVRTGSAWTMATSSAAVIAAIRKKRIGACIDMEFFARFSAAESLAMSSTISWQRGSVCRAS